VAAVAYVDPGNVATNVTAGSRYGFLLVWVVVGASAIAVLVQYLSARLGLATGGSLPAVLGERLRRRSARLVYWLQAELVVVATDLAEIVGGAVALQLLFGLPLLLGGVITTAVSLLVLGVRDRRGQRTFERLTIALLVVVSVGFLLGLVIDAPSGHDVAAGLVPRFAGTDSVLVAAGVLGATVMPHAIYLHSSLVPDRHGHEPAGPRRRELLAVTRLDVGVAMALAAAVNLGLLVLAATSLQGQAGTDTISGAHDAVGRALGATAAGFFAVGLLASGLASSSVGAYAGAVVMEGLLHVRIPQLLRRLLTALPALAVLASGVEPTRALVLSQVVLSFGIPFALIPLVRLTALRSVMGASDVVARRTTAAAAVVALAVVVLNLALVYLTVTGAG
jgi:manganese transport protein